MASYLATVQSYNQPEKGIYNLDSKFQQLDHLHSHMTELEVLGNVVKFTAVCSILRLHVLIL